MNITNLKVHKSYVSENHVSKSLVRNILSISSFRKMFFSPQVFEVLDADNNLRAVKQVNLDGADDCTLEGYKNEITLLKRLQPYSQFIVKMYDL